MISDKTKEAIKKLFTIKNDMDNYAPISPMLPIIHLLSLPFPPYTSNKLKGLVDVPSVYEYGQERAMLITRLFHDYPELQSVSNDQLLNYIKSISDSTGMPSQTIYRVAGLPPIPCFDPQNEQHCEQLLSNLKRNYKTEELALLDMLGADKKDTTEEMENEAAKSIDTAPTSLAWLAAKAVKRNSLKTDSLDSISRERVYTAGKFAGHKRNSTALEEKSKKVDVKKTVEPQAKRQRFTIM